MITVFEKYHLRLEDQLFAAMRVAVMIAALAAYFVGKVLVPGGIQIQSVGVFLTVFFAWSGVVLGVIFWDSTHIVSKSGKLVPLASKTRWKLKRAVIGITLPLDFVFSGYAAWHTGRLSSPFLIAMMVLIVFHAYYFPSYRLHTAAKRFLRFSSGAFAGALGFILVYIILHGSLPFASFAFWVSSFFVLVLGYTAGKLRNEDQKTNMNWRRAYNLTKLSQQIINQANQLLEYEGRTPPKHELQKTFNALSETIANYLAAQACEIFLYKDNDGFEILGRWTRAGNTAPELDHFLEEHREIKFHLAGDPTIEKSHRINDYNKAGMEAAESGGALHAAMAEFLKSGIIHHVLSSLIFKKSRTGKYEAIGIIRVTNRIDDEGALESEGFLEQDKEVIQNIAREIKPALENFRLQNKTLHKEGQLKRISGKNDLNEVFREILQSLAEMVNAGAAELLTVFEDGFDNQKKLVLRSTYQAGPSPGKDLLEPDSFLALDDSYCQELFRDGAQKQRIIFKNISAQAGHWPRKKFLSPGNTDKLVAILLEGTATSSFTRQPGDLGSPRKTPLGVLYLHPKPNFEWDEVIEQELLEFADLATASIESARFRRRYELLQKLKEGLQSLLVNEDDVFYQNLIRLVQTVVRCEACSVFLADTESHELRLRASDDESMETRRPLGDTIYRLTENNFLGKVALAKKVTAISAPELERAHLRESFLEKSFTKAAVLIAAPLVSTTGEIMGVIRCINKKQEQNLVTRAFSNVDKEVLEFSLNMIAKLLENRLNLHKLQTLYRRRESFMGSVAHEFASPLQGIVSTVEYLKRFHNKPERLKDPGAQFDFVLEEVDFLSHLIENIRVLYEESFVSSENHFRPRELEEVSLFKIVEKVQTLLRGQAKERGLEIKLRGRFPVVKVERFRLEQVLFNLLVNAIKYSKHAENKPIEIICDESANNVRVLVRNWGPGIHKEDEKNIFDKFYRGRNAHGLAATGTGLGLFVSRKIMRDLKGDLRLESREQPTEFVLDLPKVHALSAKER